MGVLQALRIPASPSWQPITAFPALRGGSAATGVTARIPAHKPDAGVHLPFLAPTLGGVRLRRGPHGPEFLLPNPSGGRGVYIAGWSVVAGFAAPTLHDTLLVGRLSDLDRIGPQDVRHAARLIALEGHAGENAAGAAKHATEALDLAALRLGAQFLIALARVAGFHRAADAAHCLDRDGFNELAGRLGWRGPELAETLQHVSVQFASVAVGGSPFDRDRPDRSPAGSGRAEPGRWGCMLSLVRTLRGSLAEEQFGRGGTDSVLLGRIIAAADRSIHDAEALLPEIEALLANPLPALDAWRSGERSIPDWLRTLEAAFDGWDRICLLWRDAVSPRMRQALIPEIATLSRIVTSSDGWVASGREPEAGADTAGAASCDRQQQRLARNQHVRARELTLELGVD